MNTALLLSGGVDSCVATHLLCEQGLNPDLFYIKIGRDDLDDLSCTSEEDLEIARLMARRYGLTLEVVDLQKEYWEKVVTYLVEKVRLGLTPNPDVMCNRLIKFGCFEEKAGYAYHTIATGHYAQTRLINGHTWLATAKDPVKDQTDFLAQITHFQLSKLHFPIGHLMKEEVRAIADNAKLPSALRKDSQGICFLGKINYNDFVRRFLGERTGNIIDIDTGQKLGTHQGYWFHTLGQRKGLGLGGGPWFVIQKNIEENILYVSRGDRLEGRSTDSFYLNDFHLLTSDPWKTDGIYPVCFKIRHTEGVLSGHIQRTENTWKVLCDHPLQGVAPGQFGVIYDPFACICIGSGEIALQKIDGPD